MKLKSYTGPEARQYFKEIATLRLKVFSEYPHLERYWRKQRNDKDDGILVSP